MKILIAFIFMLPLGIHAQSTRFERPVSIQRSNTQATVQAPKPLYRTGNWSAWKREEGVEYRFTWGLIANEARYKTSVDAIYEVRNLSANQVWLGAVRTVQCDNNQLLYSKSVQLQPRETQTVTFLTTNCGTMNNPFFRPNVVKSGRFD